MHLAQRQQRARRAGWRQRSHLLDAIATRLEVRVARSELIESYRASYKDRSPGWLSARQALRRAQAIAQARGFELAVMLYPLLWEPLEPYPFHDIHQSVESFARAQGIPFVDLLPAFAGANASELWIHPTNHHANEIANAIAGKRAAGFLRDEVLASH